MTVIRWLLRYWYIPLIAVAALAGFAIGLGRSPGKAVSDELRAIDEGEKARLDAIDRGADAANAEVDRKYRDELSALDDRQSRKAELLRGDPARRVRFLERVSGKWRRAGIAAKD